ncbi:AbrB/MazE/SpoVT family DNA-binding domain-containing protein [Pseudomonas stutzeri]|nr:AbrB/MazE/SpoVT family DNA-binding domain-containing protein [Stutzerimonas stutzeri]
MGTKQVIIEDWDGDSAIRTPAKALQELGIGVGDTLYVIEEYVGTTRCILLSKTPKIPDRTDELVALWNRVGSE